jgi:4-hydroxybenzoate polyprenyltransferase
MEKLMEIAFVWLLFAVVTAIVASSRGRSGFGWFILGLLFSFFALILVALLPSIKPEQIEKMVFDKSTGTIAVAQTTKKCPYCAEEVQIKAIKCKHCQSDLTAA